MPWVADKAFALPWGEWEIWESEQRAKYPVRFFLFDKIPEEIGHLRFRWRNRKWAVLHRIIPKHKYHIVRTDLEPGYYDPMTRILHATMNEVKEFVEGTKDTICWDCGDAHEDAWKELQIVYEWWTNKYPNRDDTLEDLPDVDFAKVIGRNSEQHENDPDVIEWRRVAENHRKAEEEWAKEEEEMLIRVIKIRNFLWYP